MKITMQLSVVTQITLCLVRDLAVVAGNLKFSDILDFSLCATKKHSQKCRQPDRAVAGRSRL